MIEIENLIKCRMIACNINHWFKMAYFLIFNNNNNYNNKPIGISANPIRGRAINYESAGLVRDAVLDWVEWNSNIALKFFTWPGVTGIGSPWVGAKATCCDKSSLGIFSVFDRLIEWSDRWSSFEVDSDSETLKLVEWSISGLGLWRVFSSGWW